MTQSRPLASPRLGRRFGFVLAALLLSGGCAARTAPAPDRTPIATPSPDARAPAGNSAEANPGTAAAIAAAATREPGAPPSRPTLGRLPWPTLAPLPTVPGQAAVPLRRLDHAGGEIGGVAVDRTRAYLTVGGRLEVLDVADPARPRRLGASALLSHLPLVGGGLGAGSALAARGGVVAAPTEGGLLVVDARDPAAPVETAWLPLDGKVLDLVGNDRVVAALTTLDYMGPAGVQLVDVADPARPRRAGFVELVGREARLWLDGDTLWTLTTPSWAAPAPASVAPSDEAALLARVAAASRTGRVDFATSGLRRLDLADPDRPRELAVDDLTLAAPGDTLPAFAVDGERLYYVEQDDSATDGRSHEVRVARIDRETGGLTPLGQWQEPGYLEVAWGWDLRVLGRQLLVRLPSDSGDGRRLQVLDVGDPAAPRRLPALDAALDAQSCQGNAAPAVGAGLLWLPCSDSLRAVDISEAGAGQELGRYTPLEAPRLREAAGRGSPQAVFAGPILWTVDDAPSPDPKGASYMLGGWQVDGPGVPRRVGALPLNGPADVLATDGHYLYAVGGRWGDVSVVDVRDPARPVALARLERGKERQAQCDRDEGEFRPCLGEVSAAATGKGRLLIGYRGLGPEGDIEVLDVFDPRHPRVLGWQDHPESYPSIVASMVAAGRTAWLRVESQVGASVERIDLPTAGSAASATSDYHGRAISYNSCLAVAGERAFVAQVPDKEHGPTAEAAAAEAPLELLALDADADGSLRSTAVITLSQSILAPDIDTSCRMAADERTLLLGVDSSWDRPSELTVVDVSDPTRLVVRGTYRGDSWPQPFALRDGIAYELSGNGLGRWAVEP